MWICKSCGSANDAAAETCEACGASKDFRPAAPRKKTLTKEDVRSLGWTTGDVVVSFDYNGIGVSAFEGTEITTITLSKDVKKIGKEAFKNCKSLTAVLCEHKLVQIAERAFYNCTSLPEYARPTADIVASDAFAIEGSSASSASSASASGSSATSSSASVGSGTPGAARTTSSGRRTGSAAGKTKWQCPSCSTYNEESDLVCVACGCSRGSAPSVPIGDDATTHGDDRSGRTSGGSTRPTSGGSTRPTSGGSTRPTSGGETRASTGSGSGDVTYIPYVRPGGSSGSGSGGSTGSGARPTYGGGSGGSLAGGTDVDLVDDTDDLTGGRPGGSTAVSGRTSRRGGGGYSSRRRSRRTGLDSSRVKKRIFVARLALFVVDFLFALLYVVFGHGEGREVLAVLNNIVFAVSILFSIVLFVFAAKHRCVTPYAGFASVVHILTSVVYLIFIDVTTSSYGIVTASGLILAAILLYGIVTVEDEIQRHDGVPFVFTGIITGVLSVANAVVFAEIGQVYVMAMVFIAFAMAFSSFRVARYFSADSEHYYAFLCVLVGLLNIAFGLFGTLGTFAFDSWTSWQILIGFLVGGALLTFGLIAEAIGSEVFDTEGRLATVLLAILFVVNAILVSRYQQSYSIIGGILGLGWFLESAVCLHFNRTNYAGIFTGLSVLLLVGNFVSAIVYFAVVGA